MLPTTGELSALRLYGFPNSTRHELGQALIFLGSGASRQIELLRQIRPGFLLRKSATGPEFRRLSADIGT